jgi:exportin-7
VEEMNQPESVRSLTKHRKIASSFKDQILFDIFNLSCSLLRQINVHDKTQHVLIGWLLKLVTSCLSFDFIGTSVDESSDDLAVVQIPSNWKTMFVDPLTLQLFFELYQNLPSEVAAQALACLVQLASIRRSLFSVQERSAFLAQLVKGVVDILQHHATALTVHPGCYHEFCRLLTRLKSNYQLGELVQLDSYTTFIQLLAQFTISSLQSWQFSANSIHYLLSLWQRLVASLPYLQGETNHHLDTFVPEITRVYITSRLESVETVLREGGENPLDDTPTVGMQLEQISTFSRCKYSKTCSILLQLLQQMGTSYQEMLEQPLQGQQDQLKLREGQLSWVVYLVSSVIGGRVSYAEQEADQLDGELIIRILTLMNYTDQHLDKRGCEHLELAYLSFLEQFRKVYIGDTIQKCATVYRILTTQLGVSDEAAVLNIIMQKIVSNLKYWSTHKPVVVKTLHLLNDLSIGFNSVRRLATLDIVQFMLENHTPENFPILSVSTPDVDMKCRTQFYASLFRLLLCDLKEDENKFEKFMGPLTVTFERIRTLLLSGSSDINEGELKLALIGICRDLRGVVSVCSSRPTYLILFEWIYPNYTEVLLHSLHIWFHDPAVTTPVLKLLAELVLNRSQRLTFDTTSPNGILLFREVSKAIVNYGKRVLTVQDIPEDKLYALKLKGVSVCFSILKLSLCGNYVNFGVFKLYGDTALEDALSVFVQLLVSIPLKSLLSYRKVSLSYYNLLEVLSLDHMDFLSQLDPEVFMYIMQSVSEGLTSLDAMISTNCCSSLDHILTFVFKRIQKKSKSSLQTTPLEQTLQLRPEIMRKMMTDILNIIMYEDCRNQWSMSRPLLPLLLLNDEFYQTFRDGVISLQPPPKQAPFAVCFDNLRDGIECNLLQKNRDRFTQNLTAFRREMMNSPKDSVASSTSGQEMMV